MRLAGRHCEVTFAWPYHADSPKAKTRLFNASLCIWFFKLLTMLLLCIDFDSGTVQFITYWLNESASELS